jgi:hypothetical protein
VLKQDGGDPNVVARAIAALRTFIAQWPDETDDGYDFTAFGMGQPQ